MRGSKDQEFEDKRPRAPCGLYCGTCGVYITHRDGNTKFRDVAVTLYDSKSEETVLDACNKTPELLYGFCMFCPSRNCDRSKGYYSCHQNADFPWDLVERFPIPVGRPVMKRAFRGATRCRSCRRELTDILDGEN